jgi:ketosteroid isomerase-like protein
MSQENVDVVRQSFDVFNAFARGQLSTEALFDTHHPQVNVHWHGEQTYPDTPQDLRGAAAVIAFTEQYRSGFADMFVEPLELIEALDGRVWGLLRQSGRGRQSGVPLVIHFFAVWTIQRERCASRDPSRARVHDPRRPGSALQGLREPRRGPRSPGPVGVGDVAGERRGREGGL